MATVQEMLKEVEQKNLAQTAARSVASPGTTVTGGTVGSLPGIASNTPVQNQAVTSTGAPAPISSPVPRYNADGSLAAVGPMPAAGRVDYGKDASGMAITASGASATPGPMDEQAIREQVRSENQQRIDAVNAAYDAMVGERQKVNEGLTGSVRAINARSGLLGSDFGTAHIAKQGEANQKAIAAINAERGLQISSIFTQINQLAENRVRAQKEEALGKANALKDQLAANKEQAREYAKTIGAAGLSIEELKTQHPNEYKKLLENGEFSDLELSLQMNAARKPAEQVQWKTDVKGNNIIVYGVNPATGQIEYHTQELPQDAAANEVKIVDGELWSIGSDGKTATKIGGTTTPPVKSASIQEYEYAKSQGYKGSFSDYQNEDANRKAVLAGSGSVAPPTSYREWELAGKPGTYADWIRSSKPPTADQMKAATFADRTTEAHTILGNIEGQFTNPTALGGFLPSVLQNADRQQFEQAKRNFVNAVLRRESGAAISSGEFSNADKQYFAQPGDSPEVLEQKRQNRETVISGLKREAGSSYSAPVTPTQLPTTDELNALREAFPGATDEELIQAGGFNQELQTSLNGNDLGELSAKYEASGDPGRIGYDSTGGWSYGKYQLAHNNAEKFVNQSPYASEFNKIVFNSEAFKKKWKDVAKRDPDGFAQAQHDYIAATHYEPQLEKLASIGVDPSRLPPVVQDVIWSTTVQHGADTDIIAQALKSLKPTASQEDLIRKIYELRWANGRNFSSSTPEVKKGVYNRFFGQNGEMKMALASLKNRA